MKLLLIAISNKVNINKKTKKILSILFFGLFFLVPLVVSATTYTPMETIPDQGAPTDFFDYVGALYKFGMGAVGIAAMIMITIGGFMYISSAGNNASMEKAKGVITDAIVGLLLAVSAYIILYTINPDLVKLRKPTIPTDQQIPKVSTTETDTTDTTDGSTSVCDPMTTGDCSTSNLQSSCFGSANAEKMSKVCGKESGGNPVTASATDKCKDGSVFSIGLFQINMITSAGGAGCNGSDIFTVNGSNSGNCLSYTTNSSGTSYCSSRDCEVKNTTLYNDCLTKLQDPQTNIALACGLSSNGSSLTPWATTKSVCGL